MSVTLTGQESFPRLPFMLTRTPGQGPHKHFRTRRDGETVPRSVANDTPAGGDGELNSGEASCLSLMGSLKAASEFPSFWLLEHLDSWGLCLGWASEPPRSEWRGCHIYLSFGNFQ